MRPYDDVTYTYCSEDADQTTGVETIERLFGFRPSLDGLRYSMSLYSGGIGVFDQVAVRCQQSPELWQALARRLDLRTPLEAIEYPEWVDDLVWLVDGDEGNVDIGLACRAFINSRRQDFQDPALDATPVFFSKGSDVNSWRAVWVVSGSMNYLSFDQG